MKFVFSIFSSCTGLCDVYSCSVNMCWRNRPVDVQLEVIGTVEWLSHTRLALTILIVRYLKFREECPVFNCSPLLTDLPYHHLSHLSHLCLSIFLLLHQFSPSSTSSPVRHHNFYTSFPCSPAHKILRLDFPLHNDSNETRLPIPSLFMTATRQDSTLYYHINHPHLLNGLTRQPPQLLTAIEVHTLTISTSCASPFCSSFYCLFVISTER